MPTTPLPPADSDIHDIDTWPGDKHTRIYPTEDEPTIPDHIFDHLLTNEWTPPPTKG